MHSVPSRSMPTTLGQKWHCVGSPYGLPARRLSTRITEVVVAFTVGINGDKI